MINPFRHEAQFDSLLESYRARADRIMVAVNLFLLAVCAALTPVHGTYFELAAIAIPTLLISHWLTTRLAGHLVTRLFAGCGFMAYTGLIIHQTGGDIEAHFSAFGLIGILLYYRDWRVIASATTFIYLHHLVLGYAQTLGFPIYVFDSAAYWQLFAIHVAYFLPFVGMMGYLAIWLRREAYETRRVISLAENIIKGDGLSSSTETSNEEDGRHLRSQMPQLPSEMPLLDAVSAMRNRLVDLIRVLPVPTAVVRIDSGSVTSLNDAWIQCFANTLEIGDDIGSTDIWPDDTDWSSLLSLASANSHKVLNRTELSLKRADGSSIDCEISVVLHDEMVPALAIITANDISLHRAAQQSLEILAHTDQLTALPNRLSFEEALAQAQIAWEQTAKPFALAMIDLDGFKTLNDTHGHNLGDQALRRVAGRLRRFVRADDLAARLGGDEFVLLLSNCQDEHQGVSIANRIVDALSTTMIIGGVSHGVSIGASIGVAHVCDVNDPQKLLQFADEALYRAKELGKNQAAGYQSVLQDEQVA